MHVKTNIEHNIIQVVILAICPLLLVLTNANQAIFYMMSTTICFLVSSVVCFIFSKYMSRNIKIFVTALLSTFIVTILTFAFKNSTFFKLKTSETAFFAVLSTLCLCIDVYFIETKGVVPHYLPKVFMDCVMFSFTLFIYAFILEFLSLGSVFGTSVKGYQGNAFFSTMTFKFIWLGILCIIVDAFYRLHMRYNDKKQMTYQKYVKKIRDEKEFQYNELYRKKLLTSKVEIKKMSEDRLEEINQKVSENVSPAAATLAKQESENIEQPEEEEKEVKEKKPKKEKKSKKSKTAKVERVFTTNKTEGGEK